MKSRILCGYPIADAYSDFVLEERQYNEELNMVFYCAYTESLIFFYSLEEIIKYYKEFLKVLDYYFIKKNILREKREVDKTIIYKGVGLTVYKEEVGSSFIFSVAVEPKETAYIQEIYTWLEDVIEQLEVINKNPQS